MDFGRLKFPADIMSKFDWIGVVPISEDVSTGLIEFQNVGTEFPILTVASLVILGIFFVWTIITYRSDTHKTLSIIINLFLFSMFLAIFSKRSDISTIRDIQIDRNNFRITGSNSEFVNFEFSIKNISHIKIHKDFNSGKNRFLLSLITRDNVYHSLLSWEEVEINQKEIFLEWAKNFWNHLQVPFIGYKEDIFSHSYIKDVLSQRGIYINTLDDSGENKKDYKIQKIFIPNTVKPEDKPSWGERLLKNFPAFLIVYSVLLMVYFSIAHTFHISIGRWIADYKKKEWEDFSFKQAFLRKRFHSITLIVFFMWYFSWMSDQVFFNAQSIEITLTPDKMDYKLDNEINKKYLMDEIGDSFFVDVFLLNLFSFKEYYASFKDSSYRSQSISLKNILAIELIDDGKIQIVYNNSVVNNLLNEEEINGFDIWNMIKGMYNTFKIVNMEGIDPLALEMIIAGIKSKI